MAKQQRSGWVKCAPGQWFNLQTARAVCVRYDSTRLWHIGAVSGADVDSWEHEVRDGLRVIDDYRGSEVIERPTVLAACLSEELARVACDMMMTEAAFVTDSGYIDLERIVRDARARLDQQARNKTGV